MVLTILRWGPPIDHGIGGLKHPSRAKLYIKFEVNLLLLTPSVHKFNGLTSNNKIHPQSNGGFHSDLFKLMGFGFTFFIQFSVFFPFHLQCRTNLHHHQWQQNLLMNWWCCFLILNRITIGIAIIINVVVLVRECAYDNEKNGFGDAFLFLYFPVYAILSLRRTDRKRRRWWRWFIYIETMIES